MQQRRNAATVSQMMAQILEIKEQSEFFVRCLKSGSQLWNDPRSWSKLLRFWVPGLWRAVILDCRAIHWVLQVRPDTFLNDPPAQEGQSFTIFNNSRNLASSSQELGHDITETARREMKRESLNTPTQSPHFQSRSGMLNHTGGTYCHIVMRIIREFLLRNGTLEKFQTLWNFKAGSLISELKFVCEQPNLKSLCCGSKKLRELNQWTNLLHRDRLQGNIIFQISMCLTRWLRQLWRRSSTRSQPSEKE